MVDHRQEAHKATLRELDGMTTALGHAACERDRLRAELEQAEINLAPNPRCTGMPHAMTAADLTDPDGRCLWCADRDALDKANATIAGQETDLRETRKEFKQVAGFAKEATWKAFDADKTIADQAAHIERLRELVLHDVMAISTSDDDPYVPPRCKGTPCTSWCDRPARLARAEEG